MNQFFVSFFILCVLFVGQISDTGDLESEVIFTALGGNSPIKLSRVDLDGGFLIWDLSVSSELVKQVLAWWRSKSATDNQQVKGFEYVVRTQHYRLWRTINTTPPWQWSWMYESSLMLC